MNKLLLIPVFLLLCLSVRGQELYYETLTDATYLHLLIPFNDMMLRADKDTVRYQFSINVSGAGEKNYYENVREITLSREQIVANAAYVADDISLNLPRGQYQVKTMLSNTLLGSSQDKDFHVVVPDKKERVADCFLIATNDGIRFTPADLTSLTAKLKSCRLKVFFSEKPDSVALWYNQNGQQRLPLAYQEVMDVDLLPLTQRGALTDLLLYVYKGDTLYRVKPILEGTDNSVSRKYSLEEQLEQIRYVASQNEWKILSKTDKDKLGDVIEQFWSKHDPTPGTARNETRIKFYDRVTEADEQFTIHKKMVGWRSDRGRIYIQYGAPDEVVSDVYPIGLYPYIEWYYYKQNKVFKFIDKTGYGNYQLIPDEVGDYEN